MIKCLIKLKIPGHLECWFADIETARAFINFTRVRYTWAKIYKGGVKKYDSKTGNN